MDIAQHKYSWVSHCLVHPYYEIPCDRWENWVRKLLLECSTTKLHNGLIASTSYGNLYGVIYAVAYFSLIIDAIILEILPKQMIKMNECHKITCRC